MHQLLSVEWHWVLQILLLVVLLTGLMLRSGEIGAAAEAWPVGIFGLGSILLFTTPLFKAYFAISAPTSRIYNCHLLFLSCQFANCLKPFLTSTGLAIFSCMPTTLSSGVALTQACLSPKIMVLHGVGPISISKFIADGVGVSVPTKQLLRSLVVTLLIPLILGKVLRESFKGVADFVDKNRKLISMISAIFLSLLATGYPPLRRTKSIEFDVHHVKDAPRGTQSILAN
ncbi:putative sodium/metabolite cotransporter BASS4, chloroplastic [Vitis vinifera]|uniref:Putative sodium/metabolite cotransporter BASS4, chloroplastic n=1 Tax=Vitis vinifera TaxID=29760 RepID=A0A438DNI5_VITVI|nr:putative sodium/metabolite cotransporter BASS4, chloroplastic [Vitis vinifera]